MKIALFKFATGEVRDIYAEDNPCSTFAHNIRISDWVEVDFPPRKPEEFVPEQLAALDKAESELREKFQQHLNQIAEARANIRALTFQTEQPA